jgi:conjugal transfer mating pair stabilization protein TraG
MRFRKPSAKLARQHRMASMATLRVSEQDVVQASRQADAARNEAVAASTERAAVLSEAFSRGLTNLHSSRRSSGSTSSSFEQVGETLNRLDQISKSVADSTGLSQSQVASIAFGAAGHLGLTAGAVGGRLNASADKSYLSGLSALEQKVLGSMSNEQLAEFKQFGDRVSRDASFMSTIANDSREAHDMTARLASTHARSERAEASLAERTAFAERVPSAHQDGKRITDQHTPNYTVIFTVEKCGICMHVMGRQKHKGP